jgi:pyruvate dehydrogenase E1 component alpha subunit
VVYVIENNKYGMGTSVQRAAAGGELYKRGEPYGIPGMAVDGMDVVAVKQAGLSATAHARAGEGPFILEMMTYRYRGHSMSDPAKYRPKEELNEMRTKHDPIDHVHQLLVDGGMSDDDKLKAIDKETRDIIADAAEFAQASPEPDPAELYTDVLVGA